MDLVSNEWLLTGEFKAFTKRMKEEKISDLCFPKEKMRELLAGWIVRETSWILIWQPHGAT